jgi:hypothetical protein
MLCSVRCSKSTKSRAETIGLARITCNKHRRSLAREFHLSRNCWYIEVSLASPLLPARGRVLAEANGSEVEVPMLKPSERLRWRQAAGLWGKWEAGSETVFEEPTTGPG